MEDRNYVMLDEAINYRGYVLHRIKAIRSFNNIMDGQIGGFIEAYDNLNGNAWVADDAKVYGNARVFDNAEISGNAQVFDNAQISGNALVCGNAQISSQNDYIVFKNWWSSGRYFTWTRSNNMWKVGCFYGTGEELIKKAYRDSERSGKEYEKVVKYVESIM